MKGVVDPEDAVKAHYLGVDAIWISNHGGRQLDTVPATILALPPIKAALRSNLFCLFRYKFEDACLYWWRNLEGIRHI